MKNLSLENIPDELRAVLESLSSRIAALEREVTELRGVSPLPEEEAGVAEAGSGSEETIDLSLDDIPATLTDPVTETITEPISPTVAEPVEVPAEPITETVAEPASSTVAEPVEVPVELPEPIELPDIPEAVSGPSTSSGTETGTETPEVLKDGDAAGYGTADDLPEAVVEEDAPRTEETLFGEIEVEDTPRKGRHGKKAAGGAVMDVMAEKDAWLHDIPGPEVKSLRSAIGLGDQILYIRRLFRGDSALYQYAIDKLNSMSTLKEAVTYVSENFPEWDPDSEDVYRFMMSVRRKIRK